MRLIDADALIELLATAIRNMQGIAKFIGAEDDPEIKMEIKTYTDILNGVKDMPTIEPERKKGKWISDRLISTNGGTYGVRRCSECEAYYQDVGYGWNYCPNCGADMREEGEQE